VRHRANADAVVVAGFGDEWSRFDQTPLSTAERETLARGYFAIFPWERLPPNPVGLDLGCGSGRWAGYVAPRVGQLHCIDASPGALAVARRNLKDAANVVFHLASVDAIPLPDTCLDFAYSLGVLHHVPHTAEGISSIAAKLKPGAPLLLYLYYAFDNRPAWFRWMWRATEPLRHGISRTPYPIRSAAGEIIATVVYWPLARLARFGEWLGLRVENMPLAVYRHRSFYVMRTDAFDRFGTRLEQRFTRGQIVAMMESAGLVDVRFSPAPPYWCVVGIKAAPR